MKPWMEVRLREVAYIALLVGGANCIADGVANHHNVTLYSGAVLLGILGGRLARKDMDR